MKKKLKILAFLLAISSLLPAQEQFNLCLSIKPKDATVKIDDRIFHLGEKRLPYCFKIAKGDYLINYNNGIVSRIQSIKHVGRFSKSK